MKNHTLHNFRRQASCLAFLLLALALPANATDTEKPALSIRHYAAGRQIGLHWQATQDAVYLLRFKADLRDARWIGKYGMQGAGKPHTTTMDITGDRGFYFIERHDLSSTELALDPDQDSVCTLDEILTAGTNPFVNRDLNTNQLPDDWEIFYSVDDPQADDETPPDSLKNLVEYHAGTDPNFSNPVSADSETSAALLLWCQFH